MMLAGWLASNVISVLMLGVGDGSSSWLWSIVHPVLVHCCSHALWGDGVVVVGGGVVS